MVLVSRMRRRRKRLKGVTKEIYRSLGALFIVPANKIHIIPDYIFIRVARTTQHIIMQEHIKETHWIIIGNRLTIYSV